MNRKIIIIGIILVLIAIGVYLYFTNNMVNSSPLNKVYNPHIALTFRTGNDVVPINNTG